MQPNPLELITELMNAHGVNTLVLKPPYESIAAFDASLRTQLFPDYDYQAIIKRLESFFTEAIIYMVEDEFHVHYIFLKLPEYTSGEDAYLLVGPYLTQPQEELLHRFMEESVQPLERVAALREYFAGMPFIERISGIEMEISILVRHLFPGYDFAIDGISLNLRNYAAGSTELTSPSETAIRMEMIEERYRIEDEMLKAIELGDHQQALKHRSSFNRFKIDSRLPDRLRDSKNYFITSNCLMRKAVQRADVHPAHIDHLSSYFVRKVEAARTTDELTQIMDEMMRKYCLLVKNHSLRRYSKPIQNVLNYIDFNYVEPLSLDTLSTLADINPSYLSAQFKKEVGTTVVEYINQSRIVHAQKLLVTTNLPINKIAEMVGIMDENYFARLFKRQTEKSATEYRRLFK